jgi:hypothetical protein
LPQNNQSTKHKKMDMFFQSIVGVEVYFQTVTVQERRGVCEYVLQDNEATAVWENLHTLSIANGRWKIYSASLAPSSSNGSTATTDQSSTSSSSSSSLPMIRVAIDAHSTGDVTITTPSHVFHFPEPYMEEEQEELLWQQFIHRVRALEKQQQQRPRSSCSSSKKLEKKQLVQFHHHRNESASMFVAIKQGYHHKAKQQLEDASSVQQQQLVDASVRMPCRVHSPTSTQPTVSSTISSGNHTTTTTHRPAGQEQQQQQQQQQTPAVVVAVSSSSPNTVAFMAAAAATWHHSSSTPTTSPSSSCCYTDGDGDGSRRGSSKQSGTKNISSEIPPSPPPPPLHNSRHRHQWGSRCRGTSSLSLLRKNRDTSTTAVECKIAGIVGNNRLWLGDDDDAEQAETAKTAAAAAALQALYQTLVDEHHVIISKNCHVAYRLGAALVVVQVMARHNTCAKIQEYGCELLACLSSCCASGQQPQQQQPQQKQQRHSFPSYSLNKTNKDRNEEEEDPRKEEQANESMLKLGGLWRVLRAMESFPHDPAVLGPACWFLGNIVDAAFLVQQQQQTPDDLAASCLRATMTAMTMHPTSVAVQEYGCYVLRKFVVRSDSAPGDGKQRGAQLVVEAGGIECIVAAMLHHVNVDMDILTEGCTVLTKLAEMNLPPNHGRGVVRRITQAQGLTALSEIIRVYQQHDDNKNKDCNKADDDGARVLLVEKASRAMHSILLAQSLSVQRLSSSGENDL